MPKPWDDEKRLRELYIDELKTSGEIAEILGCSKATIRRRLNEFDIPVRSRRERQAAGDHDAETYQKLTDPEWLREHYHNKGKSLSNIAGELGTTHQTVSNWLGRHGIDTDEGGGKPGEQNMNWKGGKPTSECEVCGESFEHWPNDPGRFCSQQCSGVWKSAEWRGPDHPAWGGGYVSGFGEDWGEQREKAIQRDNEVCQRCGFERQAHKQETGKDLHVHHITNKKQFGSVEEANKLSNLITLCISCHAVLENLPIDHR